LNMGEHIPNVHASSGGGRLSDGLVNESSRNAGTFDTLRPETKYFPVQRLYDKDRPVKIIIVGAGIGGTAAATLLSKKIRNVTIDVYDRYSKIGGTWAGNLYPGVRCDVPSHAYQFRYAVAFFLAITHILTETASLRILSGRSTTQAVQRYSSTTSAQ
jgi:hypothetical protein